MKIYKNITLFATTFVLAFALFPFSVFSAMVFVESTRSTVSVGDTFVVVVKINTEGVSLNTVEGDVAIQNSSGNVRVEEFSLANSSFSLWPRTPSLSVGGDTVAFVAGVPGGMSIEGATLFKIVVEAERPGLITINPQNISVFANDGKGTRVPVKTAPLIVNIESKKDGAPVNDDWSTLVSADVLPPEDFSIIFGQEASLFEGKKFVFFSAVDGQSGMDYYEVSENGSPAVRSGSTYVLKNQNDPVILSIVAYDKAGNKKTANYPEQTNSLPWASIIIVVLFVIVLVLYRRWRKYKVNTSREL